MMSESPFASFAPDARQRELIEAQIAHYRQQARWEPWKAVAAIIGAAAIMTAAVIALSNWRQPQTVNINLGQPLHIQTQ